MEESFRLIVHAHEYMITAGFSEEDQFQAVFKVVYLKNEPGLNDVELGEIMMNQDHKWVSAHDGVWTQLYQDIGEAIEARDM